jgi:hypothetical protein
MLETRSANALQKHAQELADAARKDGDLTKAAKAMGLEVKTSDDFVRGGALEGLGSASYLEDGFSRPDGSILGPIGLPDGAAVAEVVEHVPADMSKLPEQTAAIREDVQRQKENDWSAIFDAGVREALMKAGKIKIHQAVVQRLIARYASSS